MNQMQQEKELTENILKVVSVGISYIFNISGTHLEHVECF